MHGFMSHCKLNSEQNPTSLHLFTDLGTENSFFIADSLEKNLEESARFTKLSI